MNLISILLQNKPISSTRNGVIRDVPGIIRYTSRLNSLEFVDASHQIGNCDLEKYN
jgi:hypothetical protein